MGERLVIVGAGMAATRLVEALTRRAPGRYDITLLGAEPRAAYNRVLLSSLLAGEIGEPDLALKPADWWAATGATLVTGRAATGIDRAGRRVLLAGGETLSYDRLVLATGSLPIRLPIPGADKPGVITFRDIDDVAAMQAAAQAGRRAVVIGGGLLGLEAAYGMARGGAQVTLIHLMDRPMERQLDAEAGAMLAEAMRARGVDLVLEAETEAILGDGQATALRLRDGREYPADLVVLAAGIRPNADLARAAGLATGRGVIVDDGLATSDPAIFAIGECAEHDGVAYGLVEPCHEQAEVLAERLAGGEARYRGSLVATNLKVSGVNVFSAGDFLGGEDTHIILLRDRAGGSYRKLVLRDDRLIGALLFGDTTDALWYRDLIREGRCVAACRAHLVFGRALCEPLPLAA